MDFKRVCLSLCVSALVVSQMSMASVGSRINLTHIITVGELLDSSSNSIIQASIGEVGDDPSTWTITTLSASLSNSANQQPLLFSNSSGDIVVSWIYFDGNGVAQLAVGVLLSGETTWHVANVSQSVGSAIYGDTKISINESGKTYIVWSAQDLISAETVILGSTGDIYADPIEWSTPFVIFAP